MDLYEIRNATKKILREGNASIVQYEEVLPLCKQLYEVFNETNELWDVHQYVNCLKKLNKLDEAEYICSNVYNEFKDKDLIQEKSRPFLYIMNLYAWIINDKYVKTIRQEDYKYVEVVLDRLILLYDLLQKTKSNTPSFPYCALTVLNQLNKLSRAINNEKCLCILNKIESSTLTSEPRYILEPSGKTRELSSLKEDFYKLKSDFLLNNKQYEECIVCCNEAIETIDNFHYSNEIWFSRKISMALGYLGNIDEAIHKLEKLIVVSDKWFLLYEIGKYYQQLNQYDNALKYMLRAVCTKDPEKMKVSLIETIGDLFNKLGDKSFAQDNFIYARQIRKDNGWSVSFNLNKKIAEDRTITFKEIKNKWFHKLYKMIGSKQGKVAKLFQNKSGGFVQSDKLYYFQFKNFFGKCDLLKIGDYVEFIVVNSYDKKKEKETEEAVAMMPLRR